MRVMTINELFMSWFNQGRKIDCDFESTVYSRLRRVSLST